MNPESEIRKIVFSGNKCNAILLYKLQGNDCEYSIYPQSLVFDLHYESTAMSHRGQWFNVFVTWLKLFILAFLCVCDITGHGPHFTNDFSIVIQIRWKIRIHYNDVIMGTIAAQITRLTIVYSTVYLEADQRKHQSSASLAVVRGIHRGPVNSPHKWPVTQKKFPFDDVIMTGKSRGNISWWSVENCTVFFYWQRQLDVITLPWSSTDVRAWMSNHTLFKAQQCREICQCSCTRHFRGI